MNDIHSQNQIHLLSCYKLTPPNQSIFNLKSPKLNVTETPPQPEHIYLTRRNKIAKLAGMHFAMPAKDMLNQCLKPNVGFGAVVFHRRVLAIMCHQTCTNPSLQGLQDIISYYKSPEYYKAPYDRRKELGMNDDVWALVVADASSLIISYPGP